MIILLLFVCLYAKDELVIISRDICEGKNILLKNDVHKFNPLESTALLRSISHLPYVETIKKLINIGASPFYEGDIDEYFLCDKKENLKNISAFEIALKSYNILGMHQMIIQKDDENEKIIQLKQHLNYWKKGYDNINQYGYSSFDLMFTCKHEYIYDNKKNITDNDLFKFKCMINMNTIENVDIISIVRNIFYENYQNYGTSQDWASGGHKKILKEKHIVINAIIAEGRIFLLLIRDEVTPYHIIKGLPSTVKFPGMFVWGYYKGISNNSMESLKSLRDIYNELDLKCLEYEKCHYSQKDCNCLFYGDQLTLIYEHPNIEESVVYSDPSMNFYWSVERSKSLVNFKEKNHRKNYFIAQQKQISDNFQITRNNTQYMFNITGQIKAIPDAEISYAIVTLIVIFIIFILILIIYCCKKICRKVKSD